VLAASRPRKTEAVRTVDLRGARRLSPGLDVPIAEDVPTKTSPTEQGKWS
jgi:hypothetical protein